MEIYTRYLQYIMEKDVETRNHPNIAFKETDRTRTEQSDVNHFSSYVYFMFVNQLEHKKGRMENSFQKTMI